MKNLGAGASSKVVLGLNFYSSVSPGLTFLWNHKKTLMVPSKNGQNFLYVFAMVSKNHKWFYGFKELFMVRQSQV